MSTSAFTAIVSDGLTSLQETLVAFLPIILPAAILLAIFFGAYFWVKHAGRGR